MAIASGRNKLGNRNSFFHFLILQKGNEFGEVALCISLSVNKFGLEVGKDGDDFTFSSNEGFTFTFCALSVIVILIAWFQPANANL